MVSPYLPDFSKMPVGQLRFEYEKRQRQVSGIEGKISRLDDKVQRIEDAWNAAWDRATSRRGGVSAFDPSGYQSGQNSCFEEISRLRSEISRLQSEMAQIQTVLDQKWK